MILFRYCIERLNLYTDIARAPRYTECLSRLLSEWSLNFRMSSFSSALARTSESASVRSAPSVPSGIRSIDETRRRGHPSQRARSIAQCLYLICPDDDSTRATSKKNLGAEKRVYSSIHVLSWAPKLHPVPSACARALVLTPIAGVGATCPHKLLLVKTVVCSVFLTPAPGHQFHQRSTGLCDKDKILTVVAS